MPGKKQFERFVYPLTPTLSPIGGEGDSSLHGLRQMQAVSAFPVVPLAPIGGEGRGEGIVT